VAVLVVEGTVVGVVAGTVVGVVDEGGGLVPVDPVFGGAPAVVEVVGEPVVADAAGNEPSVRRADFVWKLRTPASPAAVAAMTIGVRLICGHLSSGNP